ncbi:MAG: hypothetical protein RLZ98_3103 [Pseudomonadota bacterium]|jgi:hypothetical protein
MADHPEEPPFQKSKLTYIAIKIAVIVAAVYLAVRLFPLWWTP